MLFLAYINGISTDIKEHIRLFADDALLHHPVEIVADGCGV